MHRWVVRRANSLSTLAGIALGATLGLAGCANGDEDTTIEDAGSDAAAASTAPDTGTARDASPSTTPDATLSDDSGSTGADDAGDDAADGGEDSAASDDTGTGDDTGTSDDAGGADTGTVDATSPVDAGTPDAPRDDDTGVSEDSGYSDGNAPPLSFTNPLQVDVSSILTVDTIGTTGTNGTTINSQGGALTSMDGSGYDLYTAAVASANFVSGGFPSNGLFPTNGTQHPVVQLHVADPSTAPNSVLLDGPSPNNATSLTFAVPPNQYTQLQIYATSTEGSSSLTITLTYADTTTGTVTLTVPDWGQAASATGAVFALSSSLGRIGTGQYDTNDTFAIYGANLGPDSTRSLVNVSVKTAGSGRLVFYGATGW